MALLKITNPNHEEPIYVPKGVRVYGPDSQTVEEVAVEDMPEDVKRNMGGEAKINQSVAAQAAKAEEIYGPDWETITVADWAASRPGIHKPEHTG